MPRNPDYQTLHAGTDAAATRRQVELERRELLEPHRNYQLVDCDQHYYEPDDCFTRHLESKYRNEAIEVRRDQADGLGRIYRAGKRFRHLAGPLGERIHAPGSLREYFKSGSRTARNDSETFHASEFPEFVNDREARLRVMDSHEVEAVLMLPTLGVQVESECCATRECTPEVWFALMRSFNRWLEEDWGYGSDGRIFGAPLVSLYDAELAVKELDRLISVGAKAVILRAGPAYGRSPADPIFDPFWSRLQEADVVVAFHLGDFGYQDFFATEWGYGIDHYPAGSLGFERLTCMGDRAMPDTIAALILGNLFGRFPGLRCMIIELGSTWLPPLLKKLDQIKQGQNRIGVQLDEDPSETYRRHFWISPYYEDPWEDIIACVGADRVLLGSDWPHPESLPEPLDILEEIGIVSSANMRKILRDNTASLLGIG